MQFRVLGAIEVEHQGLVLPLSGRRQRSLLAIFLLNANEVVSSDRLVDDLWSGEPPANATAALHNHISRLRRELGAELVVTRPCGYVLAAEPDAVDAARFERLLDQGERLLRAGNASAAVSALDGALELWRGRPFEEVAYEPFVQAESARLEERRLVAQEARIDAELALGRHAGAVCELEALVYRNPLRERPRAQLMLALYRAGRQAEALAAYQGARTALVDELGIEPSPALRRLEQAILRQDPSLDAAPVVAERAVPTTRRHGSWPCAHGRPHRLRPVVRRR